MENATMGKVLVTAKIENLHDVLDVEAGRLAADQVRSLEVSDALVDTGATMLSMPKRLIAHLGLRHVRTRQARTAAGLATVQVYGSVRLTIQEHDFPTDVTEWPDDCPVLIGQLALEAFISWLIPSANS